MKNILYFVIALLFSGVAFSQSGVAVNPSTYGSGFPNGALPSGTTVNGASAPALNTAQTWTAAQTFTNSDICLLGSSTGCTTFTSANASGTAYTLTIPAATDTLGELGQSQTWTGTNTFTANPIVQLAGTSGNTWLRIQPNATTNVGYLSYYSSGGFEKWQAGVGTSANNYQYYIYDVPATRNDLTIAANGAAAFMANGGALTLGDSGDTTTLASATLTMSHITTGTNADFLCRSSAGVVLLQTSACTISSRRFKEHIVDFKGDVLASISQLEVASFNMKASEKPNPDPNYGTRQIGLIAENIAKVMPECAIYEDDMKTPKSYRQECVIAMLVKGEQELIAQNHMLQARLKQVEHHSYNVLSAVH